MAIPEDEARILVLEAELKGTQERLKRCEDALRLIGSQLPAGSTQRIAAEALTYPGVTPPDMRT